MILPKVDKILIKKSASSTKIQGYLVNINNPSVAEIMLLARWRRKNKRWFRDTKPVTFPSTEKWWQTVQENPLRILFWVENNKGQKVGHMGLNRFKAKSCELDNVIRGPKTSPGIMGNAVSSLIDWTFKNLPIKRIYLQTNYDNGHAIRFYEKSHFKIIKNSKPLVKMKYSP